MRRMKWQIIFAACLLAASAAMALIHFLLFRDAKTLFFYLLLDLGFIPIQVLVVSLILDGLLARREKRAMRKKLNMVIGAFFSEAGTRLLGRLSRSLPDIEVFRKDIHPTGRWSAKEFDALARIVAGREIRLDAGRGSLEELKQLLSESRDFILRLLENSTLLEHDSFAELLWALLHVAEELQARPCLAGLPGSDLEHLSADLTRAYGHLLREWVAYLRHLKEDYPYLFSLAARTNPFDPSASALVT